MTSYIVIGATWTITKFHVADVSFMIKHLAQYLSQIFYFKLPNYIDWAFYRQMERKQVC